MGGRIVGRPICALPDMQYASEVKVAGSLLLLSQLPVGASVGSPALPAVLQSAFAGVAGVPPCDVARLQVAPANVGSHRLLAGVAAEAAPTTAMIEVIYEILVRDPARTPIILQDFRDLADWVPGTAGTGEELALFLRHYGIRLLDLLPHYKPVVFEVPTAVASTDPAALAPATQYPRNTLPILGSFLGLSLGLPLLACALHAALRRRARRPMRFRDKE